LQTLVAVMEVHQREVLPERFRNMIAAKWLAGFATEATMASSDACGRSLSRSFAFPDPRSLISPVPMQRLGVSAQRTFIPRDVELFFFLRPEQEKALPRSTR